jgi:ech hydrogenase subunit D
LNPQPAPAGSSSPAGSMTQIPALELIAPEQLLQRVGELRRQGYRLVQVSATRLPDQLELTYSFDLEYRLVNLRLQLAASGPRVTSISSIYWCAFLYENEIHDLFGLQVDGLAVDFHGKLYQTATPFPFLPARPPTPAPAAPATPAGASTASPSPAAT